MFVYSSLYIVFLVRRNVFLIRQRFEPDFKMGKPNLLGPLIRGLRHGGLLLVGRRFSELRKTL